MRQLKVEMQPNYNLQPVYIVGPTASGKSELAFLLAKSFDGVIISADSMQLYRGLDIGTAKESVERRREIPHKLIDVAEVWEDFSVARYAELAKAEIEKALSAQKLPIIVGGTGLYFDALIYPFTFASTNKNNELRDGLESELASFGAQHMHDKLEALDCESAAKLHVNDTKRVIRALEIVLTTGKTRSQQSDGILTPDVIMVGLNTARENLYAGINARVDKMFEDGLLDEIRQIKSFDWQSMQAIGYKEFADYCVFDADGECRIAENSLEEVKEKIKKHTRNYAKRQLTWFKKYSFAKWFECGDYQSVIDYIAARLEKKDVTVF